VTDRASRVRAAVRALEEARFGAERTLNLRSALPTAQEAVDRADAWLRSLQARSGGEVLIITGRGNQSVGGVSVVREAIVKLLSRLKRLGVITGSREHTPGSFVVDIAPMRTLLEAPRRHRDGNARQSVVEILPGLDADTHALLVRLANSSLERLGVRDSEQFVADEMRRQFTLIARELPDGPGRDEHLRAALLRAIAEYEDA
jgi:hypothetical protein